MQMNKKYQKQPSDPRQIENQIINLQKQLLGVQYLSDKMKLAYECQQNDQQFDKMSPCRQSYCKTLIQKVSSDEKSKRNFAEIILLQDPQIRKKQFEIRQLINLNEELQKAEQKLGSSIEEQHEAQKRYWRYLKSSKAQEVFNKFVRQKLIKNIQNLENEISEVYEIGGRSSISSSSIGNYAIQDWINQQKQQKLIKQQQKLVEEIQILEKELQNM